MVIFHFCYGDSNQKHIGTRRRITTGERHFGTFSVATECGFSVGVSGDHSGIAAHPRGNSRVAASSHNLKKDVDGPNMSVHCGDMFATCGGNHGGIVGNATEQR